MTDAIDYDALVEKTTSIDDMADGHFDDKNRDLLRLLKNDDEVYDLSLSGEDNVDESFESGHNPTSKFLGWLGYFMKKSTHI